MNDDQQKQQEAMANINFYNQAKKVIIRSGGPEKLLNLKIFCGLIRELRIKLDITKRGIGPDKLM